jgi:hypothetical protein
MHSSQNEQDTRWYWLQSYVPVLEPSNPAEACKMAWGFRYFKPGGVLMINKRVIQPPADGTNSAKW